MTDQPGPSFITTLTHLRATKNGPQGRDSRCVGFLNSFDEAKKAVEVNAGDINEAGTFPLCVIETMSEGIYPVARNTAWFAWNVDAGGYREISGPPEDLKQICGFSIG